jgi:hypothetical protein
MKKFIFFQLLMVLMFSYLPAAQIDFINPSNLSGCLEYQGYDRSGGITLHFRNRCDIGLFARACVTNLNGSVESKASTSRIPKYGRWNITFFESYSPKSVDWKAAVTSYELPASCS